MNRLYQVYPKSLSISIESRENNEKQPCEALVLKYTRISMYEFGFNLVDPLKEKVLFPLSATHLDYSHKGLTLKLCDLDNRQKVLAMNNRGKPMNFMGYNGGGDLIYIERVDGKELEMNANNKVYLYGIDATGNPVRKYWFSRNGDNLNGYLDENKKTSFDLFMIEKV